MVLWNICICPFSTKSLGIPGIVCIYWASRFSLHFYLKNGSLLLVIICLLLITKDLIVRRFFVNASPLTIYRMRCVNRPFVLLTNMISSSATNCWDKYIIRNLFSSWANVYCIWFCLSFSQGYEVNVFQKGTLNSYSCAAFNQ